MRSLVLVIFALAACKSDKEKADPPAAPSTVAPPTAPPAAPKPGGLTDAQIAAIVVAANQVDIDAGALAAKKSKHAEVTRLANLMVTDHTAVNQAAVALVTRLGVTPEETDASRGLVSGGAATRARLEALDGAAFDKAYVDNEVAYHEEGIRVVDTALVPAATNADLKQMLVGVRPALVTHLEHAKQVQAALAGGTAAAHAGH